MSRGSLSVVVIAALVAHAEARPPKPTKPNVKLSKLDYGMAPPDNIDDDGEIARHRAAFMTCYRDALAGAKPFTATFDITLAIRANGGAGVRVGGQVAAAAEQAQLCIVAELRRIKFRAGVARTGTLKVALVLVP
jgi:hypothetical protein